MVMAFLVEVVVPRLDVVVIPVTIDFGWVVIVVARVVVSSVARVRSSAFRHSRTDSPSLDETSCKFELDFRNGCNGCNGYTTGGWTDNDLRQS